MSSDDTRRRVPRTDSVLADPRLKPARERLGADTVKRAVHDAQDQVRRGEIPPGDVAVAALAALPVAACSLRPILNATGVVLHTNLGRAALSTVAVDAIVASAGYVDLEYDVISGVRARRGRGALDALLMRVPAAQDALIVNNGAAALVLTATALAPDRDIIVSKGELVEIGDGFRIPELLASTGATMREVGTTNRTNLGDYQAAVSGRTGFILKVHPSNFIVHGFTSSVSVRELSNLGVPVIADIGSGLLAPEPSLPGEPDAATWLADGAAIITASGDKLLGGPQAGLILGRHDLIQTLRRHPVARALRVDKLVIAALEATLIGAMNPTRSALLAEPEMLRARAAALAISLAEQGVGARAVPSDGVVGGGGAPGLILHGWAVELAEAFAEQLRIGETCVVARVEHGHCLVDLRCIPIEDDQRICSAILNAAERLRDPDEVPSQCT